MNRCLTSFAVVALVLVGMLLCSCAETPAGDVADSPLPFPTEASGPVTLVDALGRTVEFPEPPRHIVVAGKSSLTIINTLYLFPEAKDRVVGVVVGNQKPGDFLAFVDPAFEQKAALEVEAGPEQIAPLEPDAVVLRSFMSDELGTPLEQLGIPVVYLDLETPEQYFRDVATLGQLFGNEARAEEILFFYQSRLDYVSERLRGLSQDQKPRTLIVQYNDQGGEVALNVPSTAWLQTTEAELAGAAPVWKEAAQGGGWTVVNFEQIAAWNPDWIFVIHYKSDSAEIVDKLKADRRWQALEAVKAGQIYGFASDIFSWDQPDPRWILGVTWLAGKVHTERFSDLDAVQEASQFFQQMYGMDEASVQEHILANLKGDVE